MKIGILTSLQICHRTFIAVCVSAFCTPSLSADDPPTGVLSVPAKILDREPSRSSSIDTVPSMGRTAPPVATLPSQRRPQYQSGYKRSEQLSRFEDGEIRFVLLVPDLLNSEKRPLLFRLIAKIDGRPFPDRRDESSESPRKDSAVSESNSQDVGDLDERQQPIQSGEELPTDAELRTDAELSGDDALDTEAAGETVNDPIAPDDRTEDGSEIETPESLEKTKAYQLSTDVREVARRYAEATGEPLSDEETKWLSTHWTDGPALLLLHPYFQAFRAQERPAFRVFDRDRDNHISKHELDSAVKSLEECDANRDQIVDVMEIAGVAGKLREISATESSAPPLLLLVEDLRGTSKESELLFRALKPFDTNKNGRLDDDEVDQLMTVRPDVDLQINFDTEDADKSRLNFVATSLSDVKTQPATFAEGINLQLSRRNLNIIAVQGAASHQVSLGAVQDGYPLLPTLDPNDDGRFTIRERRELNDRLTAFDRDGDGEISAGEAIAPIRICVGLGATAHRELASVRGSRRASGEKPTVIGPEWFVRMDRNKDNDLSRNEFSGNDEQFQSLDSDQDQLISAEEASEFDNAAAKQ